MTAIEPKKNIYPGTYTPTLDFDETALDFGKDVEDVRDTMPISLKEYPDHYIIEVPLPATPRENILLTVNDEIVSLVIKDADIHIPKLHLNKLDSKGYACHNIRLSEHIETGFISATYRKGLLNIYIPKSDTSCGINNQEVAIY